jgi:hypothetical protein
MAALGRRHRNLVDQAAGASATVAALAPLAARVVEGDPQAPWRVEISGTSYDNRGDAARALDRHLPRFGVSRPLRFVDAKVEYAWRPGATRDDPGRLELITSPLLGAGTPVVVVDDRSETGLVGALTRATNQVQGLPAKVEALHTQLGHLRSQIAQVEGADRSDFPHRGELVGARHRLTELSAELAERYAPPEPAPAPPASQPSAVTVMPPGGPIFPRTAPSAARQHDRQPAPAPGSGREPGFER